MDIFWRIARRRGALTLGHLRLAEIFGIACIGAVVLGSPWASSASADGIEGTVRDGRGVVAGAGVDAVPEGGGDERSADTASDGTYQLALEPGSYSVGITPPSGDDGYLKISHVVVSVGSNTPLDATLPPTTSAGQLSGTAQYPDGSAAAGVEVYVNTAGSTPTGTIPFREIFTDPSGSWSYGLLPAGTYVVFFEARSATGELILEATQYVTVGGGESLSLATSLSGPAEPGEATIHGSVRSATGGPAAYAHVSFTSIDGYMSPSLYLDAQGEFTLTLLAGPYNLAITGNGIGLDSEGSESFTSSVSLSGGQSTNAVYTLLLPPPYPVPPGTSASNTARDLAYLNVERARWGLPAGIEGNATWSQACAAHNAYLATNRILEHPEDPTKPGYSLGGNWAGTNSILASSSWVSEGNPWEDAPLHLNQMMSPGMHSTGIDESRGYQCMTTWPGINDSGLPAGVVFTYPGNGTSGLPPAENASERPFVPGQFIGLPEGTIAGRELFVYEVWPATSCPYCYRGAPAITSASLVGPEGAVPIRWLDGSSEIGSYLTGAIIVPVRPLSPNVTYIARVTLTANIELGVPEVSHEWSFSTGAANPSGLWPGRAGTLASITGAAPARHPVLSALRVTPASFRAANRGSPLSSQAHNGTGATISYTDTEKATTQFRVLRKLPGRLQGRSCRAPSRRLSRARRCTRLLPVRGLFEHRDAIGMNRLHFTGRLANHRLPAGVYELKALAYFGSVSRPAYGPFRIVR